MNLAQTVVDQLTSLPSRQPETTQQQLIDQDLAYLRAYLMDNMKIYHQLTQRLEQVKNHLAPVEVDDQQLESDRTQVEDQISQHLLEILGRDPRAWANYQRLQRLKRHGLTPQEENLFRDIQDQYLDTFAYLPNVDSETIDSYQLPNGVTIWFDYQQTLNQQGYNHQTGVAYIFVTIEGKTYQLPMRPEFMDKFLDLYEQSELAERHQARQRQLEIQAQLLEQQLADIYRRLVKASQEALDLLEKRA